MSHTNPRDNALKGGNDQEKDNMIFIENASQPPLLATDERKSANESAEIEDIQIPEPGTPERILAERRLVRKLDLRLLPAISLIYIMNYIDRNGITTARLQGLEQDLGLSDLQYSAILSILYVTYCPMQVPANMMINYVRRPSVFIGACVVFWGMISALTGVTRNFSDIAACRVFLGLPEAAFYPGAVYLLSRWYTKKELGLRCGMLYCGLLISNAFGALMAAGILGGMEGKRGIRAWRWLFFIEGSVTITIGFFSMWALPDYPHNTSWIKGAERKLAQVRLAEDAGEADRDTSGDSPWKGLKMAVQDPKVWLFSILNIAQLLGLSFIAFFPTLTKTLGFNNVITLLLAAPPWFVASAVCCLSGWHADKTGERFFHVAGWWWVVCIGYIMALSSSAIGARYVSLILMACGYAGFSMTLVWVCNVVTRPPAQRAAAVGMVNGIGNLGNLMGSYVWKAEWGPGYHQSMAISFGALGIATALSIWLRQILVAENKRLDADELRSLQAADKERVEEAARLEGLTFEQAMEKRKGFRYLY